MVVQLLSSNLDTSILSFYLMNYIKMSYHNWDYRVARVYMSTGETKITSLIRISMLSKYGGSGQANTYKTNNCAIT